MRETTTKWTRAAAAVCLTALISSGCAAKIEPQGYSIAGNAPALAATPVSKTTAAAPVALYQLSEEERAQDCGHLTGRMKIRILHLKDGQTRARTSELSRSLQTVTSVFGGSSTGSNPDGDIHTDRAMLEAYNQQLAAKGCKTLDLENELRPDAVWTTDAKPAPKQ